MADDLNRCSDPGRRLLLKFAAGSAMRSFLPAIPLPSGAGEVASAMAVQNMAPVMSSAALFTLSGLAHKALGVSVYPLTMRVPDPILDRPYSYLRKISDFDYFISPDKDQYNVYAAAKGLSIYFAGRLGALIRLYSYDEQTLAAAQSSPDWEESFNAQAPEREGCYRINYNFENSERLGVLTHEKIAGEIASLASQMVSLSKKADSIGYKNQEPCCPTALDAIVQQSVFFNYGPPVDKKDKRCQTLVDLGLSDLDKVFLFIEAINYNEWLPVGKYLYYHERPGLYEIPQTVLEQMGRDPERWITLASARLAEDPNYSLEGYERRMQLLRQAIASAVPHKPDVDQEIKPEKVQEAKAPLQAMNTVRRVSVVAQGASQGASFVRSALSRVTALVPGVLKTVFTETKPSENQPLLLENNPTGQEVDLTGLSTMQETVPVGHRKPDAGPAPV